MNPAGGAGATNALHDAISLANYIYALPPRPTIKDTDEAFTAYTNERIPWAKAAFDSSNIYKTMASTVRSSYHWPCCTLLLYHGRE